MQVTNFDLSSLKSSLHQYVSGEASSPTAFIEALLEGKNDPVNSAARHEQLVSTSVRNALMRLQEKGSVFDDDDLGGMARRGVTETDRQRFAEMIQEAAETGGYDDPIAYIQALSAEDQDLLMRIHSLADVSVVKEDWCRRCRQSAPSPA